MAIFHMWMWTWVSRYQNLSILDFIGVRDDGGCGDNWSYKACKAPIKSSLPTNQHPPITPSVVTTALQCGNAVTMLNAMITE